jgi:hypothetical protein
MVVAGLYSEASPKALWSPEHAGTLSWRFGNKEAARFDPDGLKADATPAASLRPSLGRRRKHKKSAAACRISMAP